MNKRRNPVAHTPLLRKGGAHEQAKTAQRRTARHALQDEAWDCWQEIQDERATGVHNNTLPVQGGTENAHHLINPHLTLCL